MRSRLVTQMDVGLMGMISDSNRLFGSLYSEMKGHQRTAVYVVSACTLVMVGLMLITAVIISRSVVHPLSALQRSTETVGSGDLSHRVGLASRDEVGDLSRAFDQMTERLEQTTASRDVLAWEVAERLRAEANLNEALDKLKRSNEALEQFAYVASHDLQEPLRKIRAFGDMLAEDCGDQLSEDGQDYMRRMLNATRRMQQLIGDLLALSRVTTKGKPFAPVDMNEVLRDVVSDLDARIRDTDGRVDVGVLPTIDADETQMRQLFQNLVGNALKFHREGEEPWVKVDVRGDVDGSCRFVVEDNGIGFDEKYSDRIFGVFQRLHGRQEYEGSGIGLSVCRKIAERHNGAIEVRSRPGEGSVFTITLPREQAAENRQAEEVG
jgi:light-regulated signal transduction histidine kinase (bacteriophytochrome)